MAASLRAKGGLEIVTPAGFFVENKQGPLKAGELTRVEQWSKHITEAQDDVAHHASLTTIAAINAH